MKNSKRYMDSINQLLGELKTAVKDENDYDTIDLLAHDLEWVIRLYEMETKYNGYMCRHKLV